MLPLMLLDLKFKVFHDDVVAVHSSRKLHVSDNIEDSKEACDLRIRDAVLSQEETPHSAQC
jgi:hypothetical protein